MMHQQMEQSYRKKEEPDWFASDLIFNSIYPRHIQEAAQKHWTPIEVAISVANYLSASPGMKILDIGSGSGKFCFTAANYHRDAHFYGVEQRKELVDLCDDLKEQLQLSNVTFINQNITDINFSDYDHFYFYNSFYENIDGTQKIDYTVPYSEKLYDYYNLYVYKQLKKLPAGTKIATFHSFGNEIPPGYEVVHTSFGNYLQFWVKL
ncbi:MAG: methyltransferase domain-containing protein [Ginsengibacter sp.]